MLTSLVLLPCGNFRDAVPGQPFISPPMSRRARELVGTDQAPFRSQVVMAGSARPRSINVHSPLSGITRYDIPFTTRPRRHSLRRPLSRPQKDRLRHRAVAFPRRKRRLVRVLACSPVLPHIAPGSHREPVDLQFFCSAFDSPSVFRAANRAKRLPGILSQARRDRGTHVLKILIWPPH